MKNTCEKIQFSGFVSLLPATLLKLELLPVTFESRLSNANLFRKFTENFTEKLYWNGTPAYALFVERRQTATSEISSKIKTAVPDKFTKAAVRRYFSKQMFLKMSHYSHENTCVGVSF